MFTYFIFVMLYVYIFHFCRNNSISFDQHTVSSYQIDFWAVFPLRCSNQEYETNFMQIPLRCSLFFWHHFENETPLKHDSVRFRFEKSSLIGISSQKRCQKKSSNALDYQIENSPEMLNFFFFL